MLATICWTIIATKALACGPILPVVDVERRFHQVSVATADGIDPARIVGNANLGLSNPWIVREGQKGWQAAKAAAVSR